MQRLHAGQIVNCPLTKGLNLPRPVFLYSLMSTVLIEIRRAKAADATLDAAAHDDDWRTSDRGIIPGHEL